MTDICCIGHITRDRIITTNPPATTHCAGGSAYYMAWAIEALPRDVDFHMITSVSSEVMPEVEKLRQAGIRVTPCSMLIIFCILSLNSFLVLLREIFPRTVVACRAFGP